MLTSNDRFAASDEKYLMIRKEFAQLIKRLNQIAIEPFETNPQQENIINIIPIHWSIHQFYLFIDFLYKKYNYGNIGFLVFDEHDLVRDCFLIQMNEIETTQGKKILQFQIILIPENKTIDKQFENINLKINKKENITDAINQIFKNFINNKTIDQLIILPYFIKETLTNLNLPTINTNAFDFYATIADFFKQPESLSQNSKLKWIFDHFDGRSMIFRALTNFFSEYDQKDIEIWNQIWATVLDELAMNVIIILNQKPTIGFKFLVENEKLTLNPINISYLKDFTYENSNPWKIGEKVFNKTGLRTLVIEESQILRLLKEYANSRDDKDPFELLITYFSEIYAATWYPDSLLNSFLKLFGLELGKDMFRIPLAIQKISQYFENILIIMYFLHPYSGKLIGTIFELIEIDNKPHLKYIEAKPFKSLFQEYKENKIELTKQIQNSIEKQNNRIYSAVFGFDIERIADTISTRNIQAYLGISNMTFQLPFIAAIGGLFTSIKALGIEKEQEAIVTLDKTTDASKKEKSEQEKMDIIKFYDEFLKRGIICLLNEEKTTMNKIRSPIYSSQGYLGLELEELKKIILKRASKGKPEEILKN